MSLLPASGPAGMTREGRRATLLGGAAPLLISLAHVPGYEKSKCFTPELHFGSVLAACVGGAVGLVGAAQLVAAIAGRGRAGVPWPRGVDAAHALLVAVAVGFLGWGLGREG